MAHTHSHDGGIGHSHDDPFNGHGHSHEILDGPGSYVNREMPLIEGRDWKDRAFTVGIGGWVLFLSCEISWGRLRSIRLDCLTPPLGSLSDWHLSRTWLTNFYQARGIWQDGPDAGFVPCSTRRV